MKDLDMTLYEHLLSRGLDPKDYHCVIDEDECIATFFLFDLTGRITGYQRYNPRSTDKKCNDPKLGRYYTYTPRGTDAIFGLETDDKRGPLFVCEAVFKQAAIRNAGFNAIATLGSDPKRLRPWFGIIEQTRPLIGIGDNDPAGEKFVRRVGYGTTSPTDLDEMGTEDVRVLCRNLIENYNFHKTGCHHHNTKKGPRIPLRYGSAATLICLHCNWWRQERRSSFEWQPPEELTEALNRDDDEY